MYPFSGCTFVVREYPPCTARGAQSGSLYSFPFGCGVVIVLSALHFDHSPKQQGARGEEHDGLLLVLRAMTLLAAGKVALAPRLWRETRGVATECFGVH